MLTPLSFIKIKENSMYLLKPIAIIATLIPLIACGGGGGSEKNAATPADRSSTGGGASGSNINEPTGSPAPEFVLTKVDRTADIMSNDSFMFKSSAKVPVDIIVPNAQSNTDYLTICLGNETTGYVDYSQCLLQTAISSQQFQGELTLTNDTLSLAIVLLDYDQPNKPYISFWSRVDSPTLITL
jgi:hypothetical protein